MQIILATKSIARSWWGSGKDNFRDQVTGVEPFSPRRYYEVEVHCSKVLSWLKLPAHLLSTLLASPPTGTSMASATANEIRTALLANQIRQLANEADKMYWRVITQTNACTYHGWWLCFGWTEFKTEKCVGDVILSFTWSSLPMPISTWLSDLTVHASLTTR